MPLAKARIRRLGSAACLARIIFRNNTGNMAQPDKRSLIIPIILISFKI
jgi:hypothetical protein